MNVFARTVDGAAAPLRTLVFHDSNYHEDNIYGVAVDPVHEEIMVVDAGGTLSSGGIRIYDRLANGTDAPKRIITPMGSTSYFPSIAFDPIADEIYVLTDGWVFPRTGDGVIAPTRTIIGPSTLLNNPIGLALCH